MSSMRRSAIVSPPAGATDAVNAVTSVTRCPCAMSVASVAPAENAASSRCGDTASTWSWPVPGDAGRGGSSNDICPSNACSFANLRMDQGVDERTSRFPSACLPGRADYRQPPWTSRRSRRCASAGRRAPAGRGDDRGGARRRRARPTRGRAAAAARRRQQRRRRRRGLRRAPSSACSRAGVAVDDRGDRVAARQPPASRGTTLVARCVADGLAGVECLSGHPRLDGRDADPERRRLRAGGRRDHRRRCASSTARPARSPTWRRRTAASATARARSSARRAAGSCSPSTFAPARSARVGARSATPSWPARSASSRRAARRSPTCARPCSRCAAARAWCSTPATPTPVSAGSFFTNPILDAEPSRRSSAARRRRAPPPRWPEPDGRGQDLGGLAHRARRLPPRLRRRRRASRSPPSTRSRSTNRGGAPRPSSSRSRARSPTASRARFGVDARARAGVRGGCVA